MMSKSDEEQGRGLPVGWGWRPDDDHGESLYLYAPGKTGVDYHAAAYTDGSWSAYPSGHADNNVTHRDAAIGAPKNPERMAAAQRAAVAALWARDGFGVGEVRGARFGVEHFKLIRRAGRNAGEPVTLPGLPGQWSIMRWREGDPIVVDAVRVDPEGGVEVDAVRAPVAEPTPRFDDMKPREPGCLCHQEEGDSPCPVHPSEDEDPGAVVIPLWLARLNHEQIKRINAIPATGPAPWDIADGALAEAIAGPAGEPAPREPPPPARGPSCLSRGGSIKGWIGTPPPGWTPGMTPPCLACGAQAGKPCANPDDFEPQHFDVDGRGDERMPPAPTLLADGYPPTPDCKCNDDRADFCHGCDGQGGPCDTVICSCVVHAIPVNVRRARMGMAPLAEPAPTDDPGDDLARLLPGLAGDIAMVGGVASFLAPTLGASTPSGRVARACELLLGERERLTDMAERSFTIGAGEIGKREAAELEAHKLRARVAELEAANEGLAQIVNARGATPPPGTVAARRWFAIPEDQRLDRIGQIADQLADVRHELSAEDIEAAEALIEMAKGAPTPLDLAVAEVCALPVEMPTFYASVDSVEDGLHAVDMLIGDHEMSRRDRLAKIARVALAGMLACDAADGGKEPG